MGTNRGGSSPSLRASHRIDNRGVREIIDMNGIPRKMLKISPSRRNPAHGCLRYRSLAQSARISRFRSNHTPTAAGLASPTARYLGRVSPMPDVLLPSPGEPASVYSRLAHLGASGPTVAASAAL